MGKKSALKPKAQIPNKRSNMASSISKINIILGAIIIVLVFLLLGQSSLTSVNASEQQNEACSAEDLPSRSLRDASTISEVASPEDVFALARERIITKTDARLDQLLQDVKTVDCAEKVIEGFEKYHTSFVTEGGIPFESSIRFTSDCPESGRPQNEKLLPLKDAEDIYITFVMIVHENPHQVIRLINAVQHPKHSFVIHVDAKEKSKSTFDELMAYSKRNPNIYVMEEDRVSISWGGWNVVQATINAMKYVLDNQIPFDWLSNLSGYTYPLASIEIFRQGLSTQSPSKHFMEVRSKPHDPNARAWHHFVECDDKLHRITRLQKPETFQMYVGSQWFTVGYDYVQYVVNGQGFAGKFKQFAEHLVVADENYFQTVMKNSPYCHNHISQNFHHIQFDEWEHSKSAPAPEKCLQPNPKHCGRSPATITVDYIPVLERSQSLFARKFDERIDSEILDYLDQKLQLNNVSVRYQDGPVFSDVQIKQVYDIGGVPHELCLELPNSSGRVRMVECDRANPAQAFRIGPCTLDGELNFESNQCMNSTVGRFGVPFCSIRAANSMCLDLSGESKEAGGELISYSCTNRWNQLYGFGTGDRSCKIFMNIPKHYVLSNPKEVEPELCLETNFDVAPSESQFQRRDEKSGSLKISTAFCHDQSDEFQKFIVSDINDSPMGESNLQRVIEIISSKE